MCSPPQLQAFISHTWDIRMNCRGSDSGQGWGILMFRERCEDLDIQREEKVTQQCLKLLSEDQANRFCSTVHRLFYDP